MGNNPAPKKMKVIIPLNDVEMSTLLDAGLTKRIIDNFVNKGMTYKQILPKIKGKVDEIEARNWLREKMKEYWPEDTDEHKKNRESFKVPKRALPKLDPKNKSYAWYMGQKLSITFPMLPSVNHMYQTSKATGARQMTMVTKKFFIEIQELVEKEAIQQQWGPTYKSKVIANMKFFFPDNGVHDNHNMFKFLFDTMDGIVIDDDHWFMPRVEDLAVDKDNPRIELELSMAI